MVQFSPRKAQKIETILAEQELWMSVGDVALARHRKFQPHRRVSLGLATRLFELASKLGRLAVSLELCLRQTDKHPPDAFSSWNLNMAEALRRAYGGPDQTGPSPAPCP